MEPRREPSLLKLMLLRGALVGIVVGSILVLVIGVGEDTNKKLGAFVAGVILGGIFSVTAFVERLARSRDASLRRDLLAALVSGTVAFVGVMLGAFQVPYTVVALTTGSPAEALSVVPEVWDRVFGDERPLQFLSIALMPAPIFAMGTFERVRGLAWKTRACLALVTAVPCALPVLLFVLSGGGRRDTQFFAEALAACVVAIPLLLELADWLERRLAGPET
jgi:hypothetical protein